LTKVKISATTKHKKAINNHHFRQCVFPVNQVAKGLKIILIKGAEPKKSNIIKIGLLKFDQPQLIWLVFIAVIAAIAHQKIKVAPKKEIHFKLVR